MTKDTDSGHEKLAIALKRLQRASNKAFALVEHESLHAASVGYQLMLARLMAATREIDRIASEMQW